MPVLQLDDQQIPLPDGTTRLGSGAGVDVVIPGDETLGVQAVVEVGADRRAAIRRAGVDAQVRVNGVALGLEPTPLLHGDKVEIAGRELRYVEDAQAGSTRYVSAKEMASLAARKGGPKRETLATGGRLVSLVDGKEYTIPETGLRIGRDATCDVVVPLHEVSRHHAEIVPSERGYLVRDLSTNGVMVNGVKVDRSQLLGRADVLRVGTEEFRFYADVAIPTPATAAPPPMAGARKSGGVPAPDAPSERVTLGAAPPLVSSSSEPPTLAPAGGVAPAVATRGAHPAARELEGQRKRGLPVWVWVVAALLVAAGIFFVLQGR